MNYVERNNRRALNREVFQETSQYIANHTELWEATRVSLLESKIYKAEDRITAGPDISSGAKVILTGNKTANAARSYGDKKVSIMNFASATNPGGGVRRGSSAQEESICRVSTLYYVLDNYMLASYYAIHHDMVRDTNLYTSALIYTPGVVIFRDDDDDYRILDKADWKTCDVVTIAAPNLKQGGNYSDQRLLKIFEERFDRFFASSSAAGCQVAVTGAFGCGAFGNDSYLVAEALKKSILKYSKKFETIELAVYCNDTEETNYKAFRSVLAEIM